MSDPGSKVCLQTERFDGSLENYLFSLLDFQYQFFLALGIEPALFS
jgi:hypothetical protein